MAATLGDTPVRQPGLGIAGVPLLHHASGCGHPWRGPVSQAVGNDRVVDLLAGKSLMVDRVASVQEALLFQGAGASIIGAALEADAGLTDGRFVTDHVARAIRDAVGTPRFAGIVPLSQEHDGFYDRLERVLDLEPGWLLVNRADAYPGLGEYLREFEEGLPIILDGPWMDEDYRMFTAPDDLAHGFRQSHGCIAELRPDLTMVDLKGESADIWRHLTVLVESMQDEFPDELLQIADIQAVTREFPVLLDLSGVQPGDVRAFVAAFPGARGFYARLGPERGGRNSILPERLLPILDALRAG